jgi:hypothetical protein
MVLCTLLVIACSPAYQVKVVVAMTKQSKTRLHVAAFH